MLRAHCILLHATPPLACTHTCFLQMQICSILHFVSRRLSIALNMPPAPPRRLSIAMNMPTAPPLLMRFHTAQNATACCLLLLTHGQRLLLLCLCARAHIMIAELTRSSALSRRGPCHLLRYMLTSEAVMRIMFSKSDISASRIATAAATKCCVQ